MADEGGELGLSQADAATGANRIRLKSSPLLLPLDPQRHPRVRYPNGDAQPSVYGRSAWNFPPDWVLIDYAAHWAPAAAARHSMPCAFLSLFGAAALSIIGPPDALMGRGYANRKPEHVAVVLDSGYEARAKVKLDLVTNDSFVSEDYRFGKCIEENHLVGELYRKPVIPPFRIWLFPYHRHRPHESRGAEPLRWLEMQASGSIVYAAFGSEAKVTSAQLQTIALGPEVSGRSFLWAFRAPTDAKTGECTDGLPEGFEDWVNGWGHFCRGWVAFLAHASVGGFLTHAGWNSITEGLASGVRLVLVPQVFEQGLNARHMVEKKIGIEVARDKDDGLFAAEDIAAAPRRVMVEDEGEELGVKMKELAKVFGNDEVNDRCVRDFLKRLAEHSRRN